MLNLVPTIVGILTFTSGKKFMLNWVEHEKFHSLGPRCVIMLEVTICSRILLQVQVRSKLISLRSSHVPYDIFCVTPALAMQRPSAMSWYILLNWCRVKTFKFVWLLVKLLCFFFWNFHTLKVPLSVKHLARPFFLINDDYLFCLKVWES